MCVVSGSARHFFPALAVRVLGMLGISGFVGFPGCPWGKWMGPSGSYLLMGGPFANVFGRFFE